MKCYWCEGETTNLTLEGKEVVEIRPCDKCGVSAKEEDLSCGYTGMFALNKSDSLNSNGEFMDKLKSEWRDYYQHENAIEICSEVDGVRVTSLKPDKREHYLGLWDPLGPINTEIP